MSLCLQSIMESFCTSELCSMIWHVVRLAVTVIVTRGPPSDASLIQLANAYASCLPQSVCFHRTLRPSAACDNDHHGPSLESGP